MQGKEKEEEGEENKGGGREVRDDKEEGKVFTTACFVQHRFRIFFF